MFILVDLWNLWLAESQLNDVCDKCYLPLVNKIIFLLTKLSSQKIKQQRTVLNSKEQSKTHLEHFSVVAMVYVTILLFCSFTFSKLVFLCFPVIICKNPVMFFFINIYISFQKQNKKSNIKHIEQSTIWYNLEQVSRLY